jgi:hypothetical protein
MSIECSELVAIESMTELKLGKNNNLLNAKTDRDFDTSTNSFCL